MHRVMSRAQHTLSKIAISTTTSAYYQLRLSNFDIQFCIVINSRLIYFLAYASTYFNISGPKTNFRPSGQKYFSPQPCQGSTYDQVTNCLIT